MTAYYNENDPKKAAWLRELIKQNLIAPGDVDERSIEDITPNDINNYTQCHFFAGVGIWSYALRLAGWPDKTPVWTGSCPCQPFSLAGAGVGFADERHLWPAWHWLIEQRAPDVIFGEQVANGNGKAWLDLVSTDLENTGYAVGAICTPACGFGAPHIRQRMYFVADSGSERRQQIGRGAPSYETTNGRREKNNNLAAGSVAVNFVAHTNGGDTSTKRIQRSGEQRFQPESSRGERVADDIMQQRSNACTKPRDQSKKKKRDENTSAPAGLRRFSSVGYAESKRLQVGTNQENGHTITWQSGSASTTPGATNGFWRDAEWIECRDGKTRPTGPGVRPLVNGAAERVVRLRGYGDGIVAPQAAEFIKAYRETLV